MGAHQCAAQQRKHESGLHLGKLAQDTPEKFEQRVVIGEAEGRVKGFYI